MSKNLSIGTKKQYQDLPLVPANEKLTWEEINEFVSWMKNPAQSLGNFSTTLITIDGTGTNNDYTLSANTEITFAESAHENGNAHIVLITTDGSYTLTFTKPIAYNLYIPSSLTNGGTLAAGSYEFVLRFTGGSIKVTYTTMQNVAGDVTAPTISSIVISNNNSVLVTISEAAYANNDMTGDLQVADFTAGLSGGTATNPILTNPSHTAGDSTITFDLSYTGTADGGETLTIGPADGSSIFDATGNAMDSGQTGTDTLADNTPPTFSAGPASANVASTDFDITATLNENGTVYVVVVADGASAPTSAEVKAGTGSGGSGELATGNAADSGSGVTINLSGLTESTDYDAYVVAEDDEGTPNLQASPTLVNVTTTASYSFSNTHSMIIDAQGEGAVFDATTIYPVSGGNDQPISIELWYKTDASIATNTSLLRLYNNNDAEIPIVFQIATGSLLQCAVRVDGSNQKYIKHDVSLSSSTWYHFVWTYNGNPVSTTQTLTQNNNNSATPGTTGSYTGMPSPTGSPKYRIPHNSSATFGEGKYNLVRIYDKVLSSGEITTLYNSGVPTGASSLLANLVYENRFNNSITQEIGPTTTDAGSVTFDTDLPT